MLRSHISRFVRRRHQPVPRGDVDDTAPTARLHRRQHAFDRIEATHQIHADDLLPFLVRELVDWRDELNTGIVHQNIDGIETLQRLIHHTLNLGGGIHVGWRIQNLYAMPRRKFRPLDFDVRLLAESVQHDVHSSSG